MPTTYMTRQTKALTSNQIISGVSYPTYNNVTVFSFEKTAPSTSKRKRPNDLFASTTARSVSSRMAVCLKPGATKVMYSSNNILYGWTYFMGSLDTLKRNDGLRPQIYSSMDSLNNVLLNKIKDQKCNLSVSVAELGKTTDMVFNLARDIWNVFHSLRSGRALPEFIRLINDKSKPVSKRFASRFLEYTYGWTPLMLDTYGLSQLMQQRISEGQYIFVSTKKTEKRTYSPYGSQGNLISSDTLVLKGRARYKIDNRYLRTLSQSGITNPALLAWELVPYSFVIDWVINIGDYLSALDALTGISNLIVVKSGLYERRETQKTSFGTYGLDRAEAYLVERITNRLAPTSSLPAIFPRYEPSIGVRRMLNATALLRNLRP